jgi:hypothetical protein
LNTTPPVGVFSRLNDPELLSKLGQLIEHCRFARVSGIIVELFKLEELRVIQSLLDVEGERQAVEVVSSNSFVVDLHVVIDGFLVAQVIVVLHLSIHYAPMRSMIFFFFIFVLLSFFTSLEELLFRCAVHSLRVLFFHD